MASIILSWLFFIVNTLLYIFINKTLILNKRKYIVSYNPYDVAFAYCTVYIFNIIYERVYAIVKFIFIENFKKKIFSIKDLIKIIVRITFILLTDCSYFILNIIYILMKAFFQKKRDPIIYIIIDLNTLIVGTYLDDCMPKIIHFVKNVGFRINPPNKKTEIIKNYLKLREYYADCHLKAAISAKDYNNRLAMISKYKQVHIWTQIYGKPDRYEWHPFIINESGIGICLSTTYVPDLIQQTNVYNSGTKLIYASATMVNNIQSANTRDTNIVYNDKNVCTILHKFYSSMSGYVDVNIVDGETIKIVSMKTSKFKILLPEEHALISTPFIPREDASLLRSIDDFNKYM